MSDKYFDSVSSLLHFEDSGTTIIDVKGRSWACQGTATQSSLNPRFGSGSLLPGTLGVLSESHADFAFGTGDFTVEFFFRPANFTGGRVCLDSRTSAAVTTGFAIYTSSASIRFYTNGADRITGPNLDLGSYRHIAVSRVSGVTRLFVNGTQGGSNYTDSANYTDNRFSLGYQYFDNSGPTAGHYDELRITKGVGRYAADFTAPTDAFSDFKSAGVTGQYSQPVITFA